MDIDYGLVTNKNYTYGKVPDNILFDDRISDNTVRFFTKVLKYFNNPNKKGDNWTKSRSRSYFSLSRYMVDKVYGELERYGYLHIEKSYPHKCTEDCTNEFELKNHTQISWKYTFYVDPVDNKHFSGELLDENRIQKNKETKEKAKVTNVETSEAIKSDIDNVIRKQAYNLALEKWKQSEYMTLIRENSYKVDTDTRAKDYILNKTNNSVRDMDLNELFGVCWDTIVLAKCYDNDKAFQSFRYSENGKKIANINITAIRQIFNTYKVFNPATTDITLIRDDIKAARIFLIQSSIVIHNLIKYGLFGDKLPSDRELRGLFKTLSEHPELIYLENNKISYEVFYLFYTKNQERYVRQE